MFDFRFLSLLILLLLVPAPAVAGADASAPPNDDIAAPTPVTELPFIDRLDIAGATRAPDDPRLTGLDCWPTPERTVWYAFTPEDDVRVAADTFESDHDTQLAVYRVTVGGLVEIACNDDAAGTPQSRVHLDLDAATPYLFQVGSMEDQVGSQLHFTLSVSDLPLLGGITTVSPAVILPPRDGRPVLTGTITCTRETGVAIDYVIIQQRTRAYGWTEVLDCSPGEPIAWQAPVLEGGRLRPGDAQVIARTYYQDGLDYRVVPLEATVSLRTSRR